MPDSINVDPGATGAAVIRVGGQCYYRVGPVDQPPDVFSVDDEFDTCDQCSSSSSSSYGSSSYSQSSASSQPSPSSSSSSSSSSSGVTVCPPCPTTPTTLSYQYSGAATGLQNACALPPVSGNISLTCGGPGSWFGQDSTYAVSITCYVATATDGLGLNVGQAYWEVVAQILGAGEWSCDCAPGCPSPHDSGNYQPVYVPISGTYPDFSCSLTPILGTTCGTGCGSPVPSNFVLTFLSSS